MGWFACEISGRALHQRRIRYREAGRLKSRESEGVEIVLAMAELGVELYVPIEPVLIIDRQTKRRVERRFPMTPGYAFLEGVRDFAAVEALPFVHGFLRVGRDVVEVPEREIDRLRQAEAMLASAFMVDKTRGKLGQQELAKHFPEGSSIRIVKGVFEGWEARVLRVTAKRTVKAVLASLAGGVDIELSVDDVKGIDR